MLDIRVFEFKFDVYEVFDYVWNMFINVDVEKYMVFMSSGWDDEFMSFLDVVIGL